jgi:hypothetical protein
MTRNRTAYYAAYYAANREKVRARRAAYNAANPDKALESYAKHYAGNRERVLARKAAYYADNPEKSAVYVKLRRTRERLATPPWLTEEELATMRKLKARAKALGMSTDHIVPLKGKYVSGLHVPWNLQILPLEVNLKKSNKLREYP